MNTQSRPIKAAGVGCSGLLIFFLIKVIIQFLGYQSRGMEQRNLQSTYDAFQVVLQATEQVCHLWINAQNYVGQYTCIRGPVWSMQDSENSFKITLGDGLKSAVLGNFNYIDAFSAKYTWEGINKGDCLYIWGNLNKTSTENLYSLEIDPNKELARVQNGCEYLMPSK